MFTVLLMCLGFFCMVVNSVVEDTRNTDVRLVNPSRNNSNEGRLEIYFSGAWGTVCDNYFTDVSASVACASLGFSNGTFIGNRYGAGTGQIWLDKVQCTGKESGIEQCSHNQWGDHNCNHSHDVSISCDICSRNFYGPTGIITSPKFPMEYDNDLDCYNYISVNLGQTTIITFLAFSTEPNFDSVTITCEFGQAFTSPPYTGVEIPPVLAISSCKSVKVWFHTDSNTISSGFKLTYNVTSDTVIGGLTTKPTNAFPRSDKDENVIFNCTSRTKYLPWWTMNSNSSGNYTVTNSSCGVITSEWNSFWFRTETLGPGSCNLIMDAPRRVLYRFAGSFVCTDATLASAGALIVPINYELKVTKGMNSSSTITDIVRDEEVKISCAPYFTTQFSSPSLVFSYSIYTGGPVAQIRILRTYWTSQGNVVPGNNASSPSSYVLVKASIGEFPRYTCNVVCEFFSNISSLTGNSSIEISESIKHFEVLFWPIEDNIIITGHHNGQVGYSGLLSCYVPANPQATYQWIDESNGNIINTQIITIILGGKYTCNASNVIRGQYYQQSKSINVEVSDDDTNRLKIIAIILGALLGLTVLIAIIFPILLIHRCRQQKAIITAAGVGQFSHVQEQELQQKGRKKRNETGFGNPVDNVEGHYEQPDRSEQPTERDYEQPDRSQRPLEGDYDQPDRSQRPLPTVPDTYQERIN